MQKKIKKKLRLKKFLFNKFISCEKIIVQKLAIMPKYLNICIEDILKGLNILLQSHSTNAFLCSLHLISNTALLYHQSATTAQRKGNEQHD
jgi:hypothetical protein